MAKHAAQKCKAAWGKQATKKTKSRVGKSTVDKNKNKTTRTEEEFQQGSSPWQVEILKQDGILNVILDLETAQSGTGG